MLMAFLYEATHVHSAFWPKNMNNLQPTLNFTANNKDAQGELSFRAKVKRDRSQLLL